MKNRLLVAVFFLIMVFLKTAVYGQGTIFTKATKLMGSRFEITLVCEPQQSYDYLAMATEEISRIEKIISSWDPASETSAINRNAGIAPVKVSKMLYDLIQRCQRISKITSGAFDISYAAIDPIWVFDGSMTSFPTSEDLAASIENIGYEKIILDAQAQTVFLKNKGMKIGFGAIGKGFAADATKLLLISKGVQAGIINASGDLTTWGEKPDGTHWQVGISNPENPSKVFSWFPVINAAVATSGNYEKYVTLNAKRYSHIIDPRTGLPVEGLKSVTVFAPKAELADALATATFIMGVDVGMATLAQLPGISCIVIDAQNNIYYSKDLKVEPVKNK